MRLFFTLFLLLSYNVLLFSQDSALEKSEKEIESQNFKGAIEILNEYLVEDSLDSDVYLMRAKCYRKIGEYNDAILDVKKSILLNLNNAQAYCEKGTIYAINKKFFEALSSFNKAIEIEKRSEFFLNRGALYQLMENNNMAVEDYNEAIKLNPKNDITYFNVGIIYREMEKYDKGIEYLSYSLKLNSKSNKTFYERGLCYESIKDYKNAIKDYKNAIKYNSEIDPYEKISDIEINYRIGVCYEFIEKTNKAKKYFNLAKDLGEKGIKTEWNYIIED